jgi:hypothetical protein
MMAIKDKILSANDVKQSAEMYKTMKSSLNEKKDRDGGKMWTPVVHKYTLFEWLFGYTLHDENYQKMPSRSLKLLWVTWYIGFITN